MKLFVDESVDRQIVDYLRHQNHEVMYVAELAPSIPDDEVLYRANQQNMVLLTGDKDFGELVYRQQQISMGVILIRLHGLSPDHKAEIVATAIRTHEHQLMRSFSVISPSAIRIRHHS